jgi:hypothetical protein
VAVAPGHQGRGLSRVLLGALGRASPNFMWLAGLRLQIVFFCGFLYI